MTRADEVEALAHAIDHLYELEYVGPGHPNQPHETAEVAAALREYAASLREDRCAPLVEALREVAALPDDLAAGIASAALRAHRAGQLPGGWRDG